MKANKRRSVQIWWRWFCTLTSRASGRQPIALLFYRHGGGERGGECMVGGWVGDYPLHPSKPPPPRVSGGGEKGILYGSIFLFFFVLNVSAFVVVVVVTSGSLSVFLPRIFSLPILLLLLLRDFCQWIVGDDLVFASVIVAIRRWRRRISVQMFATARATTHDGCCCNCCWGSAAAFEEWPYRIINNCCCCRY